MPITEQMKQTSGHEGTNSQTSLTMALQKPAAKAAGTRVGILQDWREGLTSGKAPRRRNTLRDGR